MRWFLCLITMLKDCTVFARHNVINVFNSEHTFLQFASTHITLQNFFRLPSSISWESMSLINNIKYRVSLALNAVSIAFKANSQCSAHNGPWSSFTKGTEGTPCLILCSVLGKIPRRVRLQPLFTLSWQPGTHTAHSATLPPSSMASGLTQLKPLQ